MVAYPVMRYAITHTWDIGGLLQKVLGVQGVVYGCEMLPSVCVPAKMIVCLAKSTGYG